MIKDYKKTIYYILLELLATDCGTSFALPVFFGEWRFSLSVLNYLTLTRYSYDFRENWFNIYVTSPDNDQVYRWTIWLPIAGL